MLVAQFLLLCVGCAMVVSKGGGSPEEGLGAVSPFTRAGFTDLKERK